LKNGFANLRTFEKGVEKETGACGTGAVATALTLKEKGILDFPIKLIPTSGEELIINLVGEYPNQIENMILEGPAKVLSERQLKIPDQELNNEQNN
jgi:diaminopimelate epimerase